MDEVKRRPGRPKGSEIDDSAPLTEMARLLTDHPGLLPKTAARRVFKASARAAHLEDASIHRWQGKWRDHGSSYLQRVHDERAQAEAERQRRERAVQAKQHDPRPMWQIASELRAAGHLPGWSSGSTAFDAYAQHRETVRGALSALDGLSGLQSPAMTAGSTAFDLFREAKMPGSAIGEALRAHRALLGAPGAMETIQKYSQIGDALRRHGEVGRTLAESYALDRIAKVSGEV